MSEDVLLSHARRLIAQRAARDVAFGPLAGILAEIAHDILLLLYVAEDEGRSLSVSAAATANDNPPTTGLRWIMVLEQRRLIVREADRHDRRRFQLRLSADGRAAMERYLCRLD